MMKSNLPWSIPIHHSPTYSITLWIELAAKYHILIEYIRITDSLSKFISLIFKFLYIYCVDIILIYFLMRIGVFFKELQWISFYARKNSISKYYKNIYLIQK